MKRGIVLFSVAIIVLFFLGGIISLNKRNETSDSIKESSLVSVSAPTSISTSSIVPIDNPVVINLPETTIYIPTNTKNKPKEKPIERIVEPRKKQMVCGEWRESVNGGKYRDCYIQ